MAFIELLIADENISKVVDPKILDYDFWFPLQSLQLLSPVSPEPCPASHDKSTLNYWGGNYSMKPLSLILKYCWGGWREGGGHIFIRYADSVVFDQIRNSTSGPWEF